MKKIFALSFIISSLSFAKAECADEFHFTVAQDDSGDFKTVQDAIMHLPDFSKIPVKVFIKNGIYKEKIILPNSKTNIQFTGESKEKTVLTFDNYSKKLNSVKQEMGTSGSASFFIFGDNFTAENITFENSAGEVGQAVAVRVEADKAAFKNCNFVGNQDTLYLVKGGGRHYFQNCKIEGTVDYIFGAGTAFFENCELINKNNGYITAASTPEGQSYGYVFWNCKITGNTPDSFYLGRPWRPFAKVVFINCEMDASIKSEGWNNWGKESNEYTTYYAEINSKGKGASKSRVAWSHILEEKEAQNFTKEKVLGDWNP